MEVARRELEQTNIAAA
jgi:two-component system, sensor histidine kinase and response regulator